MKKIGILTWGMSHIAANHGFQSCTDYEEDGQVCIFGGCNIPTLSDVRMLCNDLKIDAGQIESDEYGITVFVDEWLEESGLEEYQVTGLELWKRFTAVIGS